MTFSFIARNFKISHRKQHRLQQQITKVFPMDIHEATKLTKLWKFASYKKLLLSTNADR